MLTVFLAEISGFYDLSVSLLYIAHNCKTCKLSKEIVKLVFSQS